jgi:twitching motility protein PilT
MDTQVIEQILDVVEKEAYTDIFIRPEEETRIKTPKGWMPVSQLAEGTRPTPIKREMLTELIAALSGNTEWYRQMADRRESLAFMLPMDEKGTRLRFKIAECAPRASGHRGKVINDFTVNIRKLPSKIPTIASLGLPRSATDMLKSSGGLLLVTGPTGSGKTTTLASMVDHINRNRYANIVTLEKLVEYVIPQDKSIVTQRTIPDPVPTFLKGIEDALDGQAVDVMMIGEVVDVPAMEAMLRAAESGHLVLATMHAKNAIGAISRIADMFSADEMRMRMSMLADKLIGVVAQKLLPNKRGDGYVLAHETLLNDTPAVANAIRENKIQSLQKVIMGGASSGMATLNQNLMQLVRSQTIETEVAIDAAYDPTELRDMIGR